MESPQDHASPLVFLSEQIDKSIETLKPKVKKQKSKTRLINGLTILLGALITLTIGLNFKGYENAQQNIALALSALLTAINGWSAVFDYRKLWIRQKSTLLDLYQLRNQLSFSIASKDTSNETISEVFQRYQEIWERDSNEWRSIIYKPQPQKSAFDQTQEKE